MASKDFSLRVEPAVLLHARSSLGMELEDAAGKLGLTSAELRRMEAGSKVPRMSVLRAMAKLYKRSLTYLLLDAVPPEKPLPPDRRTVGSKGLPKLQAKSILAIRNARSLAMAHAELLQAMDMERPVTRFRATLEEDPAEWGRRMREALDLKALRNSDITAKQALELAIEAVGGLGILVLRLSMPQEGLRGFALMDEEVPVIAIKRGGVEALSVKLFTLMHELGHVLLREGGICDMKEQNTLPIEKWCNAFAAEAIYPQAELLAHPTVRDHQRQGLGTAWRHMELVAIAKGYHVGLEVVLRALLEAGLTTSAFYKEKRDRWMDRPRCSNKRPERNTVKEKLTERGPSYVRLVFNAWDRQRIDRLQVADLLGLSLDRLPAARQLMA